jgi:class 3 adenylate cyclase
MSKVIVEDFERRRRARETASERVVCVVVAASMAALVLTESIWRVRFASDVVPADQALAVSQPVLLVTAITLVAHLAVLVLLALRPAYEPSRKYLLVTMRVVLMGCMCRAQWYSPHPSFGLLVPSIIGILVIVMAGLSFSRQAVVFAGCLSCITYVVMSLLGPMWPLSVRASMLTAQACGFTTAVTFFIVDGMLRMHKASVTSDRLSQFFAPEVAARIAAEPELALRAVETQVTVLFSDVSGFTERSSTMSPQQVVDLLNDYFPPMVDIVLRHGGTLEKYIGDALVAIWGAPFVHADDADRAVAAAIEMQRSLGPLNARLAAAGQPYLAIHIGLCSGPVAAGYIGTARYVQYAVIGDTTNVASRVCTAAGAGEILIADSTRRMLTRPGVMLEALTPVAVKGKAEPLLLHRIRLADQPAA